MGAKIARLEWTVELSDSDSKFLLILATPKKGVLS